MDCDCLLRHRVLGARRALHRSACCHRAVVRHAAGLSEAELPRFLSLVAGQLERVALVSDISAAHMVSGKTKNLPCQVSLRRGCDGDWSLGLGSLKPKLVFGSSDLALKQFVDWLLVLVTLVDLSWGLPIGKNRVKSFPVRNTWTKRAATARVIYLCE